MPHRRCFARDGPEVVNVAGASSCPRAEAREDGVQLWRGDVERDVGLLAQSEATPLWGHQDIGAKSYGTDVRSVKPPAAHLLDFLPLPLLSFQHSECVDAIPSISIASASVSSHRHCASFVLVYMHSLSVFPHRPSHHLSLPPAQCVSILLSRCPDLPSPV